VAMRSNAQVRIPTYISECAVLSCVGKDISMDRFPAQRVPKS